MLLHTFQGDLSATKILAVGRLTQTPLKLKLLKSNNLLEKNYKEMMTFKSLPILEINDKQHLLKANAIIRYLCTISPSSSAVYGSTPFEISQVDALLDFLTCDLEPSIALLNSVVQGKVTAPQTVLDAAQSELLKGLRFLEESLTKNQTKFLLKNDITAADVAISVMLSPMYRFVLDEAFFLKNCPEVRGWLERCFGEESVRLTVGCLGRPCGKAVKLLPSEE